MNKIEKGDIVDIIAPSGQFENVNENSEMILKACDYVKSIGLIPRVSSDIFKSKKALIASSYDPFCANTDEARFEDLKKAINSDSKIIWAIRGGYGAARLIEELDKLPVPATQKLLIGFSDITVLHIFFEQKWSWSSIHGETLMRYSDRNQENLDLIEDIIFGKKEISYNDFKPLNNEAKYHQTINAPITGGNLSLVQTSIGTNWQIDSRDKILFLEDVGEAGYRIDRMLEHLMQAHIIDGAKAVILGNFTPEFDAEGNNLVDFALNRFASNLDIPVVKTDIFGHGYLNYPLPLGVESMLTLGENIELDFLI